ncbi:hypothetical protein KAR91_64020 [Candidatus Pacearchaeota archaeon]|nr:hypothetical protein [Candidatus Pacearchaeota archaeon]
METTTKSSKNGLSVTVKVHYGITDNVIYTDGDNINTGKKTFEFITIYIKKDGKKATCRDLNFLFIVTDKPKNIPQAYARFGDTYISKDVYDIVIDTLKTARKTIKGLDYIELKTSEISKKARTEQKSKKAMAIIEKMKSDRSNHVGWCDICHSYCYSDCQA